MNSGRMGLSCNWSSPVEFSAGPKPRAIRVKRTAPMRVRRFIRVFGEVADHTNITDGPLLPTARESANASPYPVPPCDIAIMPRSRVAPVFQTGLRFAGRDHWTPLKRSAPR